MKFGKGDRREDDGVRVHRRAHRERLYVPTLRTMKLAYDPAPSKGYRSYDFTLADMKYVAANDNYRPSKCNVALLGAAFFALAFAGFCWHLA